ncbi:MAG: DUF1987 domain-containing protein [Bacteroidales bacterium]
MKNIDIPRTENHPDKPAVYFNAETGVCEISGESYMESTYTFFLPLMQWIEQYIEEVRGRIQFNVKLFYFNTSATKCLLDIFEILKKYQDNGGDAEVIWYYEEDDPDMIEEVKDFETESGLEIKITKF